jgi:hypothetical protein
MIMFFLFTMSMMNRYIPPSFRNPSSSPDQQPHDDEHYNAQYQDSKDVRGYASSSMGSIIQEGVNIEMFSPVGDEGYSQVESEQYNQP